MKEFTRILKAEAEKDKGAILNRNNSKTEKRRQRQIEQSRKDKFNYYNRKWSEYAEQAETDAQKEICKDMLYRVQNTR